MKLVRFELPDSHGEVKAGFVGLADNKAVDAATVLGRMDMRDHLDRTVDVIAYTVEKSSTLSQGLEDLSRYYALR